MLDRGASWSPGLVELLECSPPNECEGDASDNFPRGALRWQEEVRQEKSGKGKSGKAN